MARYAAKRLGMGVAVMLLVIMALFAVIHLLPGDPVVVALGPHATPVMRARFRADMGLDLPLWQQYLRFVLRLARGDLGTDIWSGAPVSRLIMTVLPATLVLAAVSLAWSVALGSLLGCVAAVWRDRWPDWLIGILSVSLVGAPAFLLALLLLLAFAVRLHWFPAIGAGEPGDPVSALRALVLPSLAVGLGWVGYSARLVRGAMLTALQENYVRTFRAYGVAEHRIVAIYALRQAIVSVATIIAFGFGSLISSSVFAEIIFSRPGIGRLTYAAVATRNYPVIMGAVLTTTVLYLVTMIATDLVIAALDPRIRAVL